MKNENKVLQPVEDIKIIVGVNFLLISLMLSFFAFVLGRFFKILNPDLKVLVLQALAFLVAFESLLVRYFQMKESRFSQNKILGTTAELFLIILITKTVSMLLSGFSTLWIEIVSWQEDFFANFFDADSIFYIFGILIIWMLSWLFSHPLNQLEEDHELMEQEKLGVVFTDRRQARRNLINLIFILGFIMIVLSGLIDYFFSTPLDNGNSSQNLLPILILYFSAGFVFLSINQYAIMKAYWYFNDMSVNPDLVKRWFFYTLIFIIFVVLLITLLPNNFNFGFDPLIEIFLQIFLFIFTVLQFLIIFPIILVITLLSSLFSGEPIQDQIQEQVQEYVPVLPQPSSEIPGLEFIKSMFFWLVFITIIVFTIRFYINNNSFLNAFFHQFQLSGWLKDFWKWIKNGFSKIKKSAKMNYQKSIENLRIFFDERQKKLPKLGNIIRKIPPRQNIILTYLEWIQWNNQSGRKRKGSQTPLEFAQALTDFNNEASDMVNTFTDTFITARYSNHIIDEEQAQEAKILLIQLKEAFEKAQEVSELNREGKS